MCKKFAPGYIAKCSDDRADPPQNKQGANFCDWFVPDPRAYCGKEKMAEAQAKDALAALFGGETDVQATGEGNGDNLTASERALEEAKRLFGTDPENKA